jgi:hypothetical protein
MDESPPPVYLLRLEEDGVQEILATYLSRPLAIRAFSSMIALASNAEGNRSEPGRCLQVVAVTIEGNDDMMIRVIADKHI